MIDHYLRKLRDEAEVLGHSVELALDDAGEQKQKFEYLRLALDHVRTAQALLTCAVAEG
jgi:hypothetical protein